MCDQYQSEPWSIITSLRRDLQLVDQDCNAYGYYMLEHHRDRLLAAAQDFGWREAEQLLGGANGLRYLMATLEAYVKEPTVKVRILVDVTGKCDVSHSVVPQVAIDHLFPTNLTELVAVSKPVWRVFISPIQTVPSIFTEHKTTSRGSYDLNREQIPNWARAAVKSGLEAEILLVNPHGNIMEGSITTPYFFRKDRWVTPSISSGGNRGTTRRYALEKGLCIEQEVRVEDLQVGELIWLSNGVRGWGLGVVNDIQTDK